MGHTADIKNLLADFATFQPTFILSVPRVFEKVYNTAKQKAHADGKGKIFDRAEKVAIAYSEGAGGRGVGADPEARSTRCSTSWSTPSCAPRWAARCACAVSGGAPLGARLGHFFRGIGVTILEGYGLTETTAGATVNLPAQHEDRHGRPARSRRTVADRRRRRDPAARASTSSTATGTTPTPPKEAHRATAGSTPATSARSTTTASSRSPAARRSSSSPPAARTSPPPCSRTACARTRWSASAWSSATSSRSSAAWSRSTPRPSGRGCKAHGKPAGAAIADLVEDPDLRAEIQAAVDEANKAVSQGRGDASSASCRWTSPRRAASSRRSLKLKRSVVHEGVRQGRRRDLLRPGQGLSTGHNVRVHSQDIRPGLSRDTARR